MITNRDLAIIAETMGVRLTRHNGGPKGTYTHTTRTISTQRGLSIAEYKSTLAHELGHAYYRDARAPNKHFHSRQERRADEYAANLLLSPEDVETALIWHNNHINPAAYELEVTEHILRTWIHMQRKTCNDNQDFQHNNSIPH